MTPERRNSSLLGNGSVNTFSPKRIRVTIEEAMFSVVSAEFIAMQRCAKYISVVVNQHATIEGAVFSVGAAPRIYNEDLRQLELELRESPELAVGKIMASKELSSA
jgi:hypothetical protein